jgi:hypothetical protein
VSLTAAGHALLPEARRTVAQADRAVEAARRGARILWPGDGAGALADGFVAVARELRQAGRSPRRRAAAAA